MQFENKLFPKIKELCQELEKEFDVIPQERKVELKKISNYLAQKFKTKKTPSLVVVCTHNSRRSHIGQIWLSVAADYFQLPSIQTFSGGTEATAFNIRAVMAMDRAGFEISAQDKSLENPIYEIKWQTEMKSYQAFSKKYDSAPNPKENFGAIMVCTQADEGCPIVVGCDFRLALPYDDPKAFDDTDLESEKYTERVKQIGREILFSLSEVKAT